MATDSMLWVSAVSGCIALACGAASTDESFAKNRSDDANGGGARAASGNRVSMDPASIETPQQFHAALAIEACNFLERCSGPLGSDWSADCVAQQQHALEAAAPASPTTIHYDPQQGAACLAAVQAYSCNALESFVNVSDECRHVLVGDFDVGHECAQDHECKAGQHCDFSLSCPGTCERLPQQDEPCADFECAVGHNCMLISDADEILDTPLCVEHGVLGQACGLATRLCQPGLACDDYDSTVPGVCRPVQDVFPEAGPAEPCHDHSQCPVGFGCDSDLSVCTALIAAGETCSGSSTCISGYFCAPNSHVCQPQAALGSACPTGDLFECASSECIDGTCQLRQDLGEPCDDDFDCTSLRCDEGVCDYMRTCD